MTNEEWDRKVEYLLNQQARFDTDMQELKQAQRQTEKALARAADILASGTRVMFENFKITDEKIRELSESQKITEQMIQNLTVKVDHHIREGYHPGAGT